MAEFCLRALVIAVAAYFCGCLNGAVIVSKYILRDDVRGHGSGNAGLTNFHRTFGGKLTAAVLLLDIVKMVAAVLIGTFVAARLSAAGQVLGPDISVAWETLLGSLTGTEQNSVLGLVALMGGEADLSGFRDYAALAKYWSGLFCLLGHMFPCTFGFKGGKGVLSGATLLFCLDWRMGLMALALFAVLVALTRYVSLGSCAAALCFPLGTVFFVSRDPIIVVLSIGMAALVIFMHRGNIRRLLKGEENRFSLRREKS